MNANTLIDDFAGTLGPDETAVRAPVADYLEWLSGQPGAAAEPRLGGDIDVRDYLLQLRVQGADRAGLSAAKEALKRFYAWAHQRGLVKYDPFEHYNFDRPFLSRAEIRRRQEHTGDPRERELARLRALNQLAEQLHRVADVQSTLQVTLATLVRVMGLKTAWGFLSLESGLLPIPAHPQHDFLLAGACGLPPALEQEDRFHLHKPPDCDCQEQLRAGRLKRAVNIVECSRLLVAARAAGDTQGLLFHATVPLIVQNRPVGLLNFATDEWQFLSATDLQLLSAVGAHVSLALERAQLFDLVQAQRTRLEVELDMARELQAGLLPSQLPPVAGFTLAAYWRSAREMSGDFYDCFPLPGGRWGLVIADVSDKGAAAALYMTMVHSLIRSHAEAAAGPKELLQQVNRGLCRMMASGMFVTLFYAVLDPATRSLAYSNAGHNPPLIKRAAGPVERLPRGNMALGVLPESRHTDGSLVIGAGDTLLAYTDGVTEANNAAGEEYGLDRLIDTLARAPHGAQVLIAAVQADLSNFIGSAAQSDDITLLAVACAGGGA